MLSLLLLACSPHPAPPPPAEVVDPEATPPAAPIARPGSERVETPDGPVEIQPIHHATVQLRLAGKVVLVDPWSTGNFDGLPKADLILVTDIHPDHLDTKQILAMRQSTTQLVVPPSVAAQLGPDLKADVVLANGEKREVDGILIEAVPMYNLVRGPSPGTFYHDKGRGDGYILTVGGTRIYLAGDTECTPEMRALTDIDIAFVPMNLPYTMTPEEAAACVTAFHPTIVYPYHFQGSDLSVFQSGVGSGTEVRIRNWYPAG
jgi:L-ascorbate metabolism protein UlaG (beta-lactamase superfamily)